jgi:hypothetical protein
MERISLDPNDRQDAHTHKTPQQKDDSGNGKRELASASVVGKNKRG